MDKIATPVILAVSAFLYFTHDAGFNFERASAEKRVAFAERQALGAVSKAQLVARTGPRSVIISADALHVQVKVRTDGGNMESRRRPETLQRACKGYLESHLDKHDIVLRLGFYDDKARMAGVMTLSPTVCERAAAMTAQA
ncbi:hypothetical protein [Hyphomonas sp.]|uniref:hypothetical protein n=1 Tax=Hyphomonas sp. TaxID=87 RepID=UPI0039194B43